MARVTKPKPVVVKRIRHNEKLPPVAQAANIALILLAAAKAVQWADLQGSPQLYSHIIVTEEQQALLDEFSYILPYLRATRSKSKFHDGSPARSIYTCLVCERFAFIDKGTPPTRCNLTLGCIGTTVKASTAAPRVWIGFKVIESTPHVESAVSNWAAAFTSGDADKLKASVGDTRAGYTYAPLAGVVQATAGIIAAAEVPIPGSKEAPVQMLVRVDLSVVTGAHSAPGDAHVSTYDLLVNASNTDAAHVVSWASAELRPSTVPFANAVHSAA